MNAATPSTWKLSIENDQGQQTSVALARDEYTIGRAEGCAVRLDERNISRAHCRLRRDGHGWQLCDDQSYNGTYLNGQRVGPACPVGPGDVVHVGDFRLELLNDAAIQARAAEQDGAAPSQQLRPSRLVMVLGPTPGKEFALDGERRTLGRAADCDIPVDDDSVNPLHCELLSMGAGRWEVVEQQGSNSVRVNGIPLQRAIIEAGDALEVGDVRWKFVGEGKFFRPTGASIAAGAIPFSQAAMPGDGTTTMMVERPSMRRWWMGGAALGLVLLVGLVLFATQSGDTSQAAQPVVESESEARGVLEDALKYGEDDLDLAHKLLKRIPADSPVRNDDDFQDLEDRWAQATIAKALAQKDKDEAMRLLNEVALTDTVSAERRYQALDILEDMGVKDLPSVPVARPASVPKRRSRDQEDIYEDSAPKRSKPSKSASTKEDLYEGAAPTPPPTPQEDVYEDTAPARPPRRPRPPPASDDPYE
ncbi:MAG: FHA domain-containing protein [Deltaproteobacteria bacterium]|jgi:pSer/pThr/pTyr-binding forkhead associated (FHA) protein|nr:FHA domain-containing protein [Deltaproteobacteria bacterium]MBW2532580.1 FHA domain-containing protein [Deltaproteobacteria bacterium]